MLTPGGRYEKRIVQSLKPQYLYSEYLILDIVRRELFVSMQKSLKQNVEKAF